MLLTNWIRDCREQLLDLVYPKICFGCKERLQATAEIYICPDCLNKIGKIQPPFCRICGRPINLLTDNVCTDCIGQDYYFTRGFTACHYTGLIKDCIHFFKYNSHTYLGCTLASFMSGFAKFHIDATKIDVILPVPLYWHRYRDRGFNQSAVLARFLSKNLEIPYLNNVLVRIKSIKPQIGLQRKDRFKNVKGAFGIKNIDKIKCKRILLIDDVYTTGATFNECSKVLIDNGAKDVWVFSLARGIS